MIASPKASDIQIHQLENQYVLPTVELIYELLKDLKMTDEVLKKRFNSLLSLVTDKAKRQKASKKVDFHMRDQHLERQLRDILGTIESELFEDIYRAMHKLLHEYYYNQCPDKQEDIANNERLNAQTQQHNAISREELFDKTVQLFGTIQRRLERIGPSLAKDQIKKLVVGAINNAKDKVLKPKPQLTPLLASPARVFIPAAQDPRFIRQQLKYEEERASELLAKQLQDEEDALMAAELAQEPSYLGSSDSSDVEVEDSRPSARPGKKR